MSEWSFHQVECDAVLEQVQDPDEVMGEIQRVMAPGGYAHVPFVIHSMSTPGIIEDSRLMA